MKDSLGGSCFFLIGSCVLLGCEERSEDAEQAPAPRATAELSAPRLNEAVQLVAARQYPAARSVLEKLQEEHPDAPRVRFFLGLTYHKEGRYDLARSHYEAIISHGPVFEDYYKAQYFYGWCLYNLGEVRRARKSFEVFLEEDPGSSDAHFGLGLIELDEGQLDEAERHFLKAVSLAGGKASAIAKSRTRLADVYLEEDRLLEAKKELEQAIALRPQQYNAYYKLYRVAIELGEEREARWALAQFEAWNKRAGR